MNSEKLNFILLELPDRLKQIEISQKPIWGKMNAQQMIEHLSDSVREANGKTPRTSLTPPERLMPMRDFLFSEKEFRPGTKNQLMGDEPAAVKNKNIAEAIDELKSELDDFQKHYENDAEKKVMSPFFGELNFKEWTHLLHKHAIHHLKQFSK